METDCERDQSLDAPLSQSRYNNSGESCPYRKFGSRRKEPVVGLVRALSVSDSENVVTTGVVGGVREREGSRTTSRFLIKELNSRRKSRWA